ncbi:hypothetical protein [Afipia clevelandensis]|nr:hypothetical protein [Afipia clevelandensis]
MGAKDDHDWSYYRGRPAPTIRRIPKRQAEHSPPRRRFRPERLPSLKSEVKRMIAAEADMSLDDIMHRLRRFEVTVSRTTVSGIMTEFRHSVRIMREAGLLK